MNKSIKVLIVIFVAICTSCSNNGSKEKEDMILEHIGITYIKKYKNEFSTIELLKNEKDSSCKITIIIHIRQQEDYNGHKMFLIYYTIGMDFFDVMPSKLIKIEDKYIAMYFHNKPPIQKKKIPTNLFPKDCGEVIEETSWIVLMCKDSYQYIVIKSPPTSFEMITQLQNFTCDYNVIHARDHQEIIIEDAIIDTTKYFMIPNEMF
jgi:hypothetical protein